MAIVDERTWENLMVEINQEAQGIPDKYLISSLTDSPVENSPNVVDPVAPADQEKTADSAEKPPASVEDRLTELEKKMEKFDLSAQEYFIFEEFQKKVINIFDKVVIFSLLLILGCVLYEAYLGAIFTAGDADSPYERFVLDMNYSGLLEENHLAVFHTPKGRLIRRIVQAHGNSAGEMGYLTKGVYCKECGEYVSEMLWLSQSEVVARLEFLEPTPKYPGLVRPRLFELAFSICALVFSIVRVWITSFDLIELEKSDDAEE